MTTAGPKTWTVRMTRAFLAVFFVWNLAWGILDLSQGHAYGLISLAVLAPIVATMAFQTRVLRRHREMVAAANRPHPDYIAIAAMEREIYGETFRHDGAPQDGRGPIASVFTPEVHRRTGTNTVIHTAGRAVVGLPGGGGGGTNSSRPVRALSPQDRRQLRSESFWVNIEEARRLTGQIKATQDDDRHPGA